MSSSPFIFFPVGLPRRYMGADWTPSPFAPQQLAAQIIAPKPVYPAPFFLGSTALYDPNYYHAHVNAFWGSPKYGRAGRPPNRHYCPMCLRYFDGDVCDAYYYASPETPYGDGMPCRTPPPTFTSPHVPAPSCARTPHPERETPQRFMGSSYPHTMKEASKAQPEQRYKAPSPRQPAYQAAARTPPQPQPTVGDDDDMSPPVKDRYFARMLAIVLLSRGVPQDVNCFIELATRLSRDTMSIPSLVAHFAPLLGPKEQVTLLILRHFLPPGYTLDLKMCNVATSDGGHVETGALPKIDDSVRDAIPVDVRAVMDGEKSKRGALVSTVKWLVEGIDA